MNNEIWSQLDWRWWLQSKYTVASLRHISWLCVAFSEDIDSLKSNRPSGPHTGGVCRAWRLPRILARSHMHVFLSRSSPPSIFLDAVYLGQRNTAVLLYFFFYQIDIFWHILNVWECREVKNTAFLHTHSLVYFNFSINFCLLED